MTPVALTPVDVIPSVLVYDLQGLDGAMTHPYAAASVVERLIQADQHLKARGGEEYGLLIWDAYRTPATQRAIYERYARDLMLERGIDYRQAYILASSFVSTPDSIFPHGTGGTVDLTLTIAGQPAEMGTGFDAFSPESAADWFRENPPRSPVERVAASNRELLRDAMESVGFIVLDEEWWHFEWGTERWAAATGNDVVLRQLQPPPGAQDAALPTSRPLARQPHWDAGVAQPFSSPGTRAAALLHLEPGYYYARSSHPTVDAFTRYARQALGAYRAGHATSSGLAAWSAVLKAVVPEQGCVVYDRYIYYEVERKLLTFAKARGWTVLDADFTDELELRRVTEAAKALHGQVDLLMFDSPRNWWLDSIDQAAVQRCADRVGALAAVDTSVQPMQNPTEHGIAINVVSLSKYPSLGFALGGLILSQDPELGFRLDRLIEDDGTFLGAEAARTIWSQMISLRDRLTAVSQKASAVAAELTDHPAVRHVRLPNAELAGGLVGGQIAFHMRDPDAAAIAERIVGHNSMRSNAALHLACTFGSCFTTFEHFASNIRHRDASLPREATNEIALPRDIVRIGLGCEPADLILANLKLVLADASTTPAGEHVTQESLTASTE